MAQKPAFTDILQVCVVVKDGYATMKKYNDDYGIGPWEVYKFNPDTVKNQAVHGKAQENSYLVFLTQIGNVQFELIEPLDDKSDYAQFLKEKGEGLHHLGVEVEGNEQAEKFFKGLGLGVVQEGNWQGLKYTYWDTIKDLGMLVETYPPPEGWDWPEPDDVYPKKA